MIINIEKTHVFVVPSLGFQKKCICQFFPMSWQQKSQREKCFLGQTENKRVLCSACSQGILLTETKGRKRRAECPSPLDLEQTPLTQMSLAQTSINVCLGGGQGTWRNGQNKIWGEWCNAQGVCYSNFLAYISLEQLVLREQRTSQVESQKCLQS